jgi:hypothetical protein
MLAPDKSEKERRGRSDERFTDDGWVGWMDAFFSLSLSLSLTRFVEGRRPELRFVELFAAQVHARQVLVVGFGEVAFFFFYGKGERVVEGEGEVDDERESAGRLAS